MGGVEEGGGVYVEFLSAYLFTCLLSDMKSKGISVGVDRG